MSMEETRCAAIRRLSLLCLCLRVIVSLLLCHCVIVIVSLCHCVSFGFDRPLLTRRAGDSIAAGITSRNFSARKKCDDGAI